MGQSTPVDGALGAQGYPLTLLGRYDSATGATDSFISRFAQERGTDWLKSTGANQSEAALRLWLKDRARFTPPKDPRALRFFSDVKDLVNPVEILAAAAKAKGGWYNVLGRFVEGAHILARASAMTPIGLAANASIYAYEVSTELIELREKQQEAQWAREYDLPMNDVVSATQRLLRRMREQLVSANDIKAYTRNGIGLGGQLAAALAASQGAKRVEDSGVQQGLIKQAYQHFQSQLFLTQSLQYLKDQQLLAMAGELQAGLMEDAFHRWALSPDRLLGPIAKDVPPETSNAWVDQRAKLLGGYVQRFADLKDEFAKAREALAGEMFLSALILTGVAAFSARSVQPKYQRAALHGVDP